MDPSGSPLKAPLPMLHLHHPKFPGVEGMPPCIGTSASRGQMSRGRRPPATLPSFTPREDIGHFRGTRASTGTQVPRGRAAEGEAEPRQRPPRSPASVLPGPPPPGQPGPCGRPRPCARGRSGTAGQREPQSAPARRPAGMLRYSSGLTVTATTPRRPSGDGGRARRKMNVCRLRLTVPPDEGSQPEQGAKEPERKKNELYHVPNGMSPGKLSHGMVYGVVHRTDNNHKREMVVYGWSADQLKEEMNYIKEVRATLEKVRKKMYGEYDEMKRKIQQLTNELKVTNAHQESLENHVRVQAAALDSFSEMNSSLTSASIDLQKTLVDVTLENTDIREQIRNLKHTHEQSMEKLREKQKQLETAQIENQLLKLKVESSQEANAEVMREMTRKLYSQYEEKMREEEQKHKAEKEILLEETNRLLKAIEEANKKMQITETSIQEKDQRIGELDRLIERMEEERHQLQKQLELNEIQISGAKSENNSDSERSQHLEEVAASLRERIKHLDDMVHCQQKKVKHMVEEVRSSKTIMNLLGTLILLVHNPKRALFCGRDKHGGR
ncbi:hypothetical protein QYF61_018888 [Mycteria americana]|uniref:Myocardial zonula adherens protein n=1 Tax=Mycteria americana TaxID=33587 RepID=A0AAN7NSW4_MYCAM|nr:hypothetical protein QYF61_018888 [Mycteria americana]